MAKATNPFKLLDEQEELPEKHKEYVLSSIDTAKFLLEIAELFTFKQIETNTTIVSTMLEITPNQK